MGVLALRLVVVIVGVLALRLVVVVVVVVVWDGPGVSWWFC